MGRRSAQANGDLGDGDQGDGDQGDGDQGDVVTGVAESVRRATEADLSEWSRLIDGWWASMASERGGGELGAGVVPPGDVTPVSDLSQLVDDEAYSVQLGLVDEVPCGLAVGSFEHTPVGLRGRVLLCYVEESARGIGLGQLLLEAVLEDLRAAGCSSVDAWALPGDRATKNHFERAGFRARLLTLHRAL